MLSGIILLQKDFKVLANPVKAKTSARFFKTNKGDYGYGDKFLGITVPEQRGLVKKYRDLPLHDVGQLMKSPYHEHRLTAVIILADQFRRAKGAERDVIANMYIRLSKYINNWDIVDSSAPHILGNYLLDKPRTLLYKLARSNNIWERRMAIIATQTFIRHGQYNDTLKIAQILLNDKHDLLHKAVGWMLREVGDRDRAIEEKFLKKYAAKMPRTMLRYAVEKFSINLRKKYMG